MKVVILAGGLGTRFSEETHLIPKPMIEIGGKPIIWHIMKQFSSYGFNEFIICCGYKGYIIKEYFANYFLHTSDVTFNLLENSMQVHQRNAEPWQVTLVDTGELSKTGGRIKRIKNFLHPTEPFFLTYGDGLSDIDLAAELAFHHKHGKTATVAAIQPPGRFGSLMLSNSDVNGFQEKPSGDGGWINGGFFILDPMVVNLIDSDSTVWEQGPMEHLAASNQLKAYKHYGFWQPMDTLRDKIHLNTLWGNNEAPWKTWS
jgi:glucose-1-phosphate cytidylyltransferase